MLVNIIIYIRPESVEFCLILDIEHDIDLLIFDVEKVLSLSAIFRHITIPVVCRKIRNNIDLQSPLSLHGPVQWSAASIMKGIGAACANQNVGEGEDFSYIV